MSIDHHDGRIDILGQWDCQGSSILEIYNECEGAISSISFRLIKKASGFYVNGLFVTTVNTDPPEIKLTEQHKLVLDSAAEPGMSSFLLLQDFVSDCVSILLHGGSHEIMMRLSLGSRYIRRLTYQLKGIISLELE